LGIKQKTPPLPEAPRDPVIKQTSTVDDFHEAQREMRRKKGDQDFDQRDRVGLEI
jgi:hypothetical protein